jgi:hypothetical protein
MKTQSEKVIDQYPHLRDGTQRQQMLVRSAVGSARIEGIQLDEQQLRQAVGFKLSQPEAAPQ